MTWFLRSIALVAFGVVLGMALWQFVFSSGSQIPAVAAGGAGATEDAQFDAPSGTIPGVLPGGVSDLSSGNVPADDVEASNLKHPLTRSLGQMIQGNRELFDQLGGEGLGDSLVEADALLWDSKQQNQDAIREVNRQVRIAAHSTNVVLVVVEGLHWHPQRGLEGFAATMPSLYRIAREGRYAPMTVDVAPTEQRRRLITGSTATADRAAGTFSQAFWNSGYTTALIGDAWWWGAGDSTADWDAWLGFQREQQAEPFPATVWSNGRPLGLKANSDGKQGIAARELFKQEALSYVRRHQRGRPFALVVSLSSSYLSAESDADKGDPSAALAEADELLTELDICLNQLEMTENTLLMVLGVSASSTEASQPDDAPVLVVRDLRRVPGDVPMPATVGYEDILPTLLHATASQRVPRTMNGTSRWSMFTARPAAN